MKRILSAAVLAGLTGLGIFMVPVSSSSVPAGVESPSAQPDGITGRQAQQQLRARGAYLAQAGNCMGCHTTQGGRPYAGDMSSTHPSGHSSRLILRPIRKPVLDSGMRRTSGGHCTMARHVTAALYIPPFPIRNIRRSRARIPMQSSPISNRSPCSAAQSTEPDPFSFQLPSTHLYLARLLLRARRLSS